MVSELVFRKGDVPRPVYTCICGQEMYVDHVQRGNCANCKREYDVRPKPPQQEIARTFETGACRDFDDEKIDYESAMSPLAFEAMCAYMHHCRKMPDGRTLRAPDNWQKGMPLDSYIKSGFRHLMDWWKAHRGLASREGIVFAICGLMFNVQGYLHEYLKANPGALEEAIKNNPRKGWEEK